MSCGEANGALLESLEAQSRLIEELRSSRLDPTWRAELLEQADRGRRAAFEMWCAHLSEPVDLAVESAGGYTTILYGSTLRILPLLALRSERALLLVAGALWEGEHRRPENEECGFAWLKARDAAVEQLTSAIAERFAGIDPPPGRAG